MALCRTDLQRLNHDSRYQTDHCRAADERDKRERAVRARFDTQRTKARLAYEAALAKIDVKEEAALVPVRRRWERDSYSIRERAIKRLGLRQIDIMDEEGLAQ